jgi:hypothetical protein
MSMKKATKNNETEDPDQMALTQNLTLLVEAKSKQILNTEDKTAYHAWIAGLLKNALGDHHRLAYLADVLENGLKSEAAVISADWDEKVKEAISRNTAAKKASADARTKKVDIEEEAKNLSIEYWREQDSKAEMEVLRLESIGRSPYPDIWAPEIIKMIGIVGFMSIYGENVEENYLAATNRHNYTSKRLANLIRKRSRRVADCSGCRHDMGNQACHYGGCLDDPDDDQE